MVVTVTDVPELGIVTLSSLQPQVEVMLTATLIDPKCRAQIDAADLEVGEVPEQDFGLGDDRRCRSRQRMHPPDATIEGYYLRATATYEDADGNDKTAQAVSVNKVRAAPATTHETAAFPTDANANDRTVAENSPAGTNVGAPVKANDTADDVLTYSLTEDDANLGGFQINPATGQITVGPRTNMDHETAPTYTVTVTVTEARPIPAQHAQRTQHHQILLKSQS